MKKSAIIVEDEPMSAGFLQNICERSGEIEVQAVFSEAVSALEYVTANKVDVIFLDVEMPGCSGFEFLDKLPYMPSVVLTTSKTEYAYDAFQYNVTDYLKKPFTTARFKETIAKINSLAPSAEKPADPSKSESEDVFIKSDGMLLRIPYDEILYVESMGDYVKYCTPTKKYVAHSTLKTVEENMNASIFMKVHRSYIVNLRKIKNIQDYTLVILDKVIPISRNLKGEVIGRLNLSI